MASNVPASMPEFDGIDFETEQGRKIKRQMESRLQQLREQNDNEQLTEKETASIRGKIHELKAMLRPRAPMQAIPRYDNQQLSHQPRRG